MSLQCFQLLTYQNAKTHTKISYIEKQNNVTKKKYFEYFFEFVMLRNDKIYVKYPIWRNEKTLRETCIMSVFELLRYQNAKTYKEQSIYIKTTNYIQSAPYGKGNDITQYMPSQFFFFFFSGLGTKTQNEYKAANMEKRKDITRNVYYVRS